MSTRGSTVRTARWGLARVAPALTAAGGVMVVVIWILLSRSALDRDLLGRGFGSARQMDAQDAVGVGGGRALGIEPLTDAHRAGERSEGPLAPVITLVGHLWLRLALAADRQRVAADSDVEGRTVCPWAQGLDGDALVCAGYVEGRVFGGAQVRRVGAKVGQDVLHLVLKAAHFTPGVPRLWCRHRKASLSG